jgi:hypothetical protein
MTSPGPYAAYLSPEQTRACDVLNPLLAVAGQPMPDMRQVYIGEKSIIEFSSYDGLTRSVVDYDMPLINTTVTLDHYTKSVGFRGIMQSGELHLAPLTRRLGQGELDTFAIGHGLKGYIDGKGQATDDMRKAAADLFYTSFTNSKVSNSLWKIFGDHGDGYRLRFEIKAGGGAQLCSIRYQGQETLLKQVNDTLVGAGLPRFIAKGISRIGAYFLPNSLNYEGETRLLAKRFEGGGAPVLTGSRGDYWPIPINTANRTASLELTQIGVRMRNPTKVRQNLPDWCAAIPIVVDS